eukprot:7382181-Prymnesium_polylepis.1
MSCAALPCALVAAARRRFGVDPWQPEIAAQFGGGQHRHWRAAHLQDHLFAAAVASFATAAWVILTFWPATTVAVDTCCDRRMRFWHMGRQH